MEQCRIESCDRVIESGGLCKPHYYRLQKYGDPLATPIRERNTPIKDKYKTENNITYKKCGECLEYFPMDKEYFYSHNTNKDGYHTYCIPCVFGRARKWVDENPKKYKEQMNRKVANKTDQQRQWSRDAARRNRDEGYTKSWQKNNPEKLKEYRLKREMNKTHTFTNEEWEECKNYFDNSCAYCGIKEENSLINYKQKLHKEHVNHSGSNGLDNCVPACKSCNGKKWTFALDEWYNIANPVFSRSRYDKIYKWLDSFKRDVI